MTQPLEILDLCSGLKGWSIVWEREGHNVTTIDINPEFKPDICIDVRKLNPIDIPFDIIFASPPCMYFTKARQNTTDEERAEGLEIALACFKLIEGNIKLNPETIYILENPYWLRGLHFYLPKRKDHHIIDYCMYGFPYRKTTSLFTNAPLEFRRCVHKKHANFNMQYTSKRRAKIPISLAQHVYDSIISNYKYY